MYIYIQIHILLTAIIKITLQKWQNRNLYTPQSFPDIRYCFPASTIVCGAPTMASGVIVLEPHNTAVSSVIFYQCQQSGFMPSAPSSVCGEDGTWSPDPSQVTCMVTPVTTTMPTGTVGDYYCHLFFLNRDLISRSFTKYILSTSKLKLLTMKYYSHSTLIQYYL